MELQGASQDGAVFDPAVVDAKSCIFWANLMAGTANLAASGRKAGPPSESHSASATLVAHDTWVARGCRLLVPWAAGRRGFGRVPDPAATCVLAVVGPLSRRAVVASPRLLASPAVLEDVVLLWDPGRARGLAVLWRPCRWWSPPHSAVGPRHRWSVAALLRAPPPVAVLSVRCGPLFAVGPASPWAPL